MLHICSASNTQDNSNPMRALGSHCCHQNILSGVNQFLTLSCTKGWVRRSWVHCFWMRGRKSRRTDMELLLLRLTCSYQILNQYINYIYGSFSCPLFNCDCCMYAMQTPYQLPAQSGKLHGKKSIKVVHFFQWQTLGLRIQLKRTQADWLFSAVLIAVLQLCSLTSWLRQEHVWLVFWRWSERHWLSWSIL